MHTATPAEAGAGASWLWRYELRGKRRPLPSPVEIRLSPRAALIISGMGRVVLRLAGHGELPLDAGTPCRLLGAAAAAATGGATTGGATTGGATTGGAAAAEDPSLVGVHANGWGLPALSRSGRERRSLASTIAADGGAVAGLGDAVRLADEVSAAAVSSRFASSLTAATRRAATAGAGPARRRSRARAGASPALGVAPSHVPRGPRGRAPPLVAVPASSLGELVAASERVGRRAVLLVALTLPAHGPSADAARAAAELAAALRRAERGRGAGAEARGVGAAGSADPGVAALAAAGQRSFDCAGRLLAGSAVDLGRAGVVVVDCSGKRGSELAARLGFRAYPKWLCYAGGRLVFAGTAPGSRLLRDPSGTGAAAAAATARAGQRGTDAALVRLCGDVAAIRCGGAAGRRTTVEALALQLLTSDEHARAGRALPGGFRFPGAQGRSLASLAGQPSAWRHGEPA